MSTQPFSYTGAEVTWQVPTNLSGTTVTVDMAGAQGGNGDGLSTASRIARKGGRLQCTLTVTPGETLRIGVAAKGKNSNETAVRAFYQAGIRSADSVVAGNGGGMSYIKRGGTADSNRVCVAGGAGGPGYVLSNAANAVGDGGWRLDTQAVTSVAAQDAVNGSEGPGGGGWVGGIANSTETDGQGGTNMAHSTQTSSVTSTPNYQEGDGYVEITYATTSGTTNQRFYLGSVDDDQTGGTTIKKLVETAPASNSTTTCTWTTTASQTRTIIPLTGTTTNSDTSNDNGWCPNNAGADGFQSTAISKRWIKAGIWNFSHSITLNNPALLATIACTITARVHRVATGGGTRTLLFTAASANFSSTNVITWASSSQPEYVLEAGEVIQIGYTAVSASTTATVFGANTNTVLTTVLGADTWAQVPAPGLRALGEGAGSATGANDTDAIATSIFSGVGSITGTGTASGTGASTASGVGSITGTGTASAVGNNIFSGVASATGNGQASAIATSIFSGVASANGFGVASAVGNSIFSGVASATGSGAASAVGNNIFSGVASANGFSAVDGFMSAIGSTVGTASGTGTANGQLTMILSTVGTITIGQGGGTTVKKIFVTVDD